MHVLLHHARAVDPAQLLLLGCIVLLLGCRSVLTSALTGGHLSFIQVSIAQ
jgi:hypothetical protein